MQLLTFSNPKLTKGEAAGYATAALHLAPADAAGVGNVCPWASDGCRAACLNTAGRGGIVRRGETSNAIQDARKARTRLFMQDRPQFLRRLRVELRGFAERAHAAHLRPAVRLNATSDLPWETIDPGLFHEFRTFAQFYDYTKSPQRMHRYLRGDFVRGYSLTFSRSESNGEHVPGILDAGGNVAVVFRNRLPPFWRRRRVVNGDETDLRFLDPRGVVVGLRAKGRAKRDASGFVVGGA
jgi:hypothetical protein